LLHKGGLVKLASLIVTLESHLGGNAFLVLNEGLGRWQLL
jgi:hypothetical protein